VEGKWNRPPTNFGLKVALTCPHFCKWLCTEGTMSRRTANKKVTKLYPPSRKRSPKRLLVRLAPQKWRGTTPLKKIPALCRRPLPHFLAGPVPPLLSNSFRLHCLDPPQKFGQGDPGGPCPCDVGYPQTFR